MNKPIPLASLSAAMDGGFTAMGDIAGVLAKDAYRLIGGVAVLLHVRRLELDLPLRATGDADFGMPPYVIRRPELAEAIEALGYRKTRGNRWERPIDDRRVATVDLLVPAYTARARNTVRFDDIVTTEVPGLATALRRPGLLVEVALHLTTDETVTASVVLPDALGMLALKAGACTVRSEPRDAEDLWRCFEVAAVEGVVPADFDGERQLEELRVLLHRLVGPGGSALDQMTAGLQPEAAARRRTRVRALLADVTGIVT